MTASQAAPQTRIQRRNREAILEASLEVFAREGYRGATLDQIAREAGLSKPNLLYYFAGKEAVYRELLEGLLETWLGPLRALDPAGEPLDELRGYVRRKLEMARDQPRESRLFAQEILRGAPRIRETLEGPLKTLVDEKAAVLRGWMRAGRLRRTDPRHLIFAVWATTQHYADFDAQVTAVLGDAGEGRFDDAARLLDLLFVEGMKPRG